MTALKDIQLGDIVSLPDGREFSVRASALLTRPVGPMGGFVIGGELEVLLAAAAVSAPPLQVYVRVAALPDIARTARAAAEGAMAYWAPHLPNVAGAMGELLYRVLDLRGSVDPMVIVFRNQEPVVFVRSHTLRFGEIRVLHMPSPSGRDQHAARHAAVVAPSTQPVYQPSPQPSPQPVPERVAEPQRVPATR